MLEEGVSAVYSNGVSVLYGWAQEECGNTVKDYLWHDCAFTVSLAYDDSEVI